MGQLYFLEMTPICTHPISLYLKTYDFTVEELLGLSGISNILRSQMFVFMYKILFHIDCIVYFNYKI